MMSEGVKFFLGTVIAKAGYVVSGDAIDKFKQYANTITVILGTKSQAVLKFYHAQAFCPFFF
jgi:hypothetical protein